MSEITEVQNNGEEVQEKTVEINAEEAKSLLGICQLALKVDGSLQAVPAINHFQLKFSPLF